MRELCIANVYLEHVQFTCADAGPSPITNELISSIAEHCPQLQAVSLINTAADYRSLITLVTNCARLQAVRVRNGKDGVEIKFSGLTLRSCNLSSTGSNDLGHALLSQLPENISVRSANGGRNQSCFLDKEGLLVLAQRHGQSLQAVGMRLRMHVSKADVRYFLSCCPQLSILMLQCANRGLLEDDDISCLSDYCPQLRSLGLFHCHKLTDDGIHRAIQQLDKLVKLNIKGCAAITDLFAPAKSIELLR